MFRKLNRPSVYCVDSDASGLHFGKMEGTVPLYVHKLIPFALLYFFFNSAGLPDGLVYTAILSPIFFLWLYSEGKRWVTAQFIAILFPFVIMQLCHGIDSFIYYAKSILLLWTVYVTVYAFCWALLRFKNIEKLFDELIIVNCTAAMIALVLLFTPARSILWNSDFNVLGQSGNWAPRLKLWTTEPSAYGELMSPLLIFGIIRMFVRPGSWTFILAILITVPVLLSQSFGTISICTAALGVALFFRFRHVVSQKQSVIILCLGLLSCFALFLVPNPISYRLLQVSAGQDSSAQVRTMGAYIEAYTIAASKSLLWGVGPGQAKLFEVNSVIKSIGFQSIVIPNATADTFASVGLVGIFAKLTIEIYLFFSTQVFKSTFRLAMFIMSFLFQFAGGNLTDVQGYLMWCFAFFPIFPDLDTLNRDSAST